MATLGDLHRYKPRGLWFWRPKCHRQVAAPLVPFVIRFGPDASSDVLRRNRRCRTCALIVVRRSRRRRIPRWRHFIYRIYRSQLSGDDRGSTLRPLLAARTQAPYRGEYWSVCSSSLHGKYSCGDRYLGQIYGGDGVRQMVQICYVTSGT